MVCSTLAKVLTRLAFHGQCYVEHAIFEVELPDGVAVTSDWTRNCFWDDWKASVSHGVVDLRLHTLFTNGELNELNNAAWQAWVQQQI